MTKLFWECIYMYCIPKKKQTGHEKASLCCRRNLSWVSNICEAPSGLNKLQEVCFGNSPSSWWANQQRLFWQANHGAYSNPGGPGTRILTLFCRHTNQSLVLSLAQARENLQINNNGICQFVLWLFKIVKGHALWLVIFPKFFGCCHRLCKFDRMFAQVFN